MSKIMQDEISSIIKERIDNFELNIDDKERGITIYGAINAVKPLVAEIGRRSKQLLSYCSLNGYVPYLGSPRRRDSLPQQEQLKKIALAQQKRERKQLKKSNATNK